MRRRRRAEPAEVKQSQPILFTRLFRLKKPRNDEYGKSRNNENENCGIHQKNVTIINSSSLRGTKQSETIVCRRMLLGMKNWDGNDEHGKSGNQEE